MSPNSSSPSPPLLIPFPLNMMTPIALSSAPTCRRPAVPLLVTRGALGRHRFGRSCGPRFTSRADGRRGRQSRFRERQPGHHHRRWENSAKAKRRSVMIRSTASMSTRFASSCVPTPPPASTRRSSSTKVTVSSPAKSLPTAPAPPAENSPSAVIFSALSCPGTGTTRSAILISERIVKDDVFTSIHMTSSSEHPPRHQLFGPEEIPGILRDLGEEALKIVRGPDGVIRIGAEVHQGSKEASVTRSRTSSVMPWPSSRAEPHQLPLGSRGALMRTPTSR